jgi:RecB family exonuclease
MLKLSPLRLRTFRRCKLRYRYQYVEHRRGRPSPGDVLGALIHATLHDFFAYVPVHDRDVERLICLLDEKWQNLGFPLGSPAEREAWRERAEELLRRFSHQHDLAAQPLALEAYYEVPIADGMALVGRIDRVDEESDGTLHIIDYKTGARPAEVDVEQLRLYAIILERKLSRPLRRASYFYLEDGEVFTMHPTQRELEEEVSEAMTAIQAIASEEGYPATIGRHCGHCPYLTVCAHCDEIAQLRQEEGW